MVVQLNKREELIPTQNELTSIFKKENPHCEEQYVKQALVHNTLFIYQERESIPILIDRTNENCMKLKNVLEFTFGYSTQGGKPGYCKIKISPFNKERSILIEKKFFKGEVFISSASRYESAVKNRNLILESANMYFQYIADTIFEFCDKYKIIETSFEVQDIYYHPVDTWGTKYGYFLRKKLIEMYFSDIFEKEEN